MERSPPAGLLVNDIHSQLNATRVREIRRPSTTAELRRVVEACSASGSGLCVAGGRHAMGTQQFGTDCVLVDTRALNRVLAFDAGRGQITVEPGIFWPELIAWLAEAQSGHARCWGIRQKQTGADRLTIGGSLSANAHGRGLSFPPIVSDVVSFKLVTAEGSVMNCSRAENPTLFSLAIGGYGLFGIMSEVTLQLSERTRLRRDVEITTTDQLMERFAERIREGYLYGDFQFSCDERSPDFLSRGVFSCYAPVDRTIPDHPNQRSLAPEDWQRLIHLAHTDKSRAFDLYAEFYKATSGQVYWSDTHQLSYYLNDYHSLLDRMTGAKVAASEMITEIYLPPARLTDFLDEVRRDFRGHGVDLFYGTIRLIEPDTETFLAWARQRSACVIFNLHTEHTPAGIAHSAAAFQRLIDMAIARSGSYFLTYHRWARRDQIEACYPEFRRFLEQKLLHDPRQVFQSDWYRHYREVFHE